MTKRTTSLLEQFLVSETSKVLSSLSGCSRGGVATLLTIWFIRISKSTTSSKVEKQTLRTNVNTSLYNRIEENGTTTIESEARAMCDPIKDEKSTLHLTVLSFKELISFDRTA